MAAGASKEKLLDWVNDQAQLDIRTKYLLNRLALYADGDCCAWAKVETLALAINGTERTVQNHLRRLLDAGLIRKTGRMHRLKGSTRSVPIYQLGPDVEGLGFDTSGEASGACSMGENISPIDGVWVKNSEGMGEKGFHPVKEPIGTKGAIAPTAGAREAVDQVFAEVEAAAPKRMLAVSDPEAARAVLQQLAEAGIDVAEIPGCLRRMAVDDLFKNRRVPVPLQELLAKRQFRAWWPEPEAANAEREPGSSACQLPDEVRAVLGEAFIAAWLGGAVWRAEDRTILTRLGVQADKLARDHHLALAEIGVSWAVQTRAGIAA